MLTLKSKLKTGVVGATAGVMVLAAPGLALAHRGGDSNKHNSGQRQAQTADSKKKEGFNGRGSSWSWGHKHDRDKERDACQERQKQVNRRVKAIQFKDWRFWSNMNGFYGQTQQFVTDNNLTVENYDALKAAADSARDNAANAIKAIEPGSVNCDDPAGDQAVIDASVQAAKEALNGYISSLFNLVGAVQQANQNQV